MKKKPGRKNPHAVALGRLPSAQRGQKARQQRGRPQGRPGQSRKKTLAARRNARRPRPARRKQI